MKKKDESPKSNYDRVKEFHLAAGLAVGQPLSMALISLRRRLIREEYGEVMTELDSLHDSLLDEEVRSSVQKSGVGQKASYQKIAEAKERLLKELSDLKYVIEGTIVSFGWNGEEAEKRVHGSNMSKANAEGTFQRDMDGKILKGPNYKRPSLKGCV